MSKQPEALAICEDLDRMGGAMTGRISSELRRLHAESEMRRLALVDEMQQSKKLHALNAELVEALQLTVQMLKEWHEDFPQSIGDNEQKAVEAARAALKKATEAA